MLDEETKSIDRAGRAEPTAFAGTVGSDSAPPSTRGTLCVGLLLLLILAIYFGLGRSRGPARALSLELSLLQQRITFIRAVPKMEDRRPHLWGLRGRAPQFIVDTLGPDDILLLPPMQALKRLVSPNDATWADPRWIASLADFVPNERYPEEGWERATHALVTIADEGEVKVYVAKLSSPAARRAVTSLWDSAMEAK